MIIYKAKNKMNGKIYIGQTKQTLKERNRQRKYSKSSFDLAFQKYGEENFEWVIIEHCKTQEEMNLKEEFWISFFDTTNRTKGYNIKFGGNNHSHSEETKKKIGDAQKGQKNHSFGKTNHRAKKIINLETNEVFLGSMEIVKKYNFKIGASTTILSVCRGVMDSYKGIKFRFLEENKIIKTKFDEEKYRQKKELEKIVYHVNSNEILNREDCMKKFSFYSRKQLDDKMYEFKKNLENNKIRDLTKFNLFCDKKIYDQYTKIKDSLKIIETNSKKRI